ncbi:cytochrome b pre-mRNA-processing protein 3 [Nitrospirillum amazonense]|uniref:Cytochrome b pre-mRNA-processing protein 3 n=1 Tax=Nitrospirillum amazonense TaxID=28077 RepID=A0A560FKJ1_9PROT|nr:ubiquinol-cytochrome C chaperone family protein [Nitrospirillum amazonense]TWB22122.1 cytochrome b pre-mRNA-processing protein 3 [Nitrospirillum amazonense]
MTSRVTLDRWTTTPHLAGDNRTSRFVLSTKAGFRAVIALLKSLFSRNRHQAAVLRLYAGIVDQARQPQFYTAAAGHARGVPDTVEGRFEVMTLHAWLVMRRLAAEGPDLAGLNQALFDHMFTDLDFSLRELGASEMVVGKKVKDLGTHFYGRADAYESGLKEEAEGDRTVLEEALDRNLFGSTLPDGPEVTAMADYVMAAAARLAAYPLESLLADGPAFPAAPRL